MTKDFSEIRKQLLAERQALLKEVQASYKTCRELGQDGVPDIGDMSSVTYDRDVLFNLSETQKQRVNDIDAALDRMDKGEYGICLECEEEISARRMEVRPFSRYCIECKTDIEKSGQ